MFVRQNDFPLLKGKAAEVRNLLKPMLDVCSKFLDPTDRIHQTMNIALQKLIQIEDILKEHRAVYVFPDAVAKLFKKSCTDFVGLNAVLRRHFEGVVRAGHPVLLFHVTIKYHYILHIADIAQYMNPRLGWCYQGESLMYATRKLVQSSCHGVPAHMIADKVLKKYAQALAMLLVRERQQGEW